ncbi:hypothetical protein [Frankia tisae]|uniref:hypothetical protein n=1 Tax=Frankia tisae TaxID=2950104 RepID=UPI0021BFB893|nr:hypothetical protein [Frankia tisae]
MNNTVRDICQALDDNDGAKLRGHISAILEEIIAGRYEYPSFRHPLGFICTSLFRDSQSGLCLHLWPDGVVGGEPSVVHAHSWDLRSFVLIGSLVNRVHQVDQQTAATQRVFEVVTDGEADTVTRTASLVTDVVIEERFVEAGSFYTLAAGLFHTSERRGSSVAATVVFGRRRMGVKDCFLGAADMQPVVARRPHCDATDALHAVHIALNLGPRRAPD